MKLCPHCNQELRYIEYYGHYLGHDKWNKIGNIYRCDNISCASSVHDYFFHDKIADHDDSVYEGYPC